MEAGSLAWDLPIASEHVDKLLAFDDLLLKLRVLHEDYVQNVWSGARAQATHDAIVPKEAKLGNGYALELSGVARATRPQSVQFTSQGSFTPRDPVTPKGVAIQQDLLCWPGSLANPMNQENYLVEQAASLERPCGVTSSGVSSSSALKMGAGISSGNGRAESSALRDNSEKMNAQDSRHVDSSTSKFCVSLGSTNLFMSSSGFLSEISLHTRSIASSPMFSGITICFMLSYAIFVAIETNMLAQDPSMDSSALKMVHYSFNAIFAIEFFLRIGGYGYEAFVGKDSFWNLLDAFFVLVAVAEIIIELNSSGVVVRAGSVVRTVRLARVFRTVRVLRAFRQFHEFQKMAYALMSSLRTLTCSLSVLLFVMFLFAVGLTQGTANEDQRNEIEDLELRYGSLSATMYTLFTAVSNGLSWDSAYMPLHESSWLIAQLLILYVCITNFGVLNVIASVFVESVLRSVQHYKELLVSEKELEKKLAISHMKQVFAQLDLNRDGSVTGDELKHFLSKPDLREYMEALEIDMEDTNLLFRLLDRDESRVIDVNEFCEGCLRLKGHARSIDMQTLMFQMRSFLGKWAQFTVFVEESLSHLHERFPVQTGYRRHSHLAPVDEVWNSPMWRAGTIEPSHVHQ